MLQKKKELKDNDIKNRFPESQSKKKKEVGFWDKLLPNEGVINSTGKTTRVEQQNKTKSKQSRLEKRGGEKGVLTMLAKTAEGWTKKKKETIIERINGGAV